MIRKNKLERSPMQNSFSQVCYLWGEPRVKHVHSVIQKKLIKTKIFEKHSSLFRGEEYRQWGIKKVLLHLSLGQYSQHFIFFVSYKRDR